MSIPLPNYLSHQYLEGNGHPCTKRSYDCYPQRRGLMKLYINEIPKDERIILAGDHTAYPRLYAETLKDRTFEHGGKVISGKPITLGHLYSTIAWIPEIEGSWALPLRHL